MKSFILFFLSLFIFNFGYSTQATELDGVAIQNISRYDGVQEEIRGPMNILMDRAFFSKDLRDVAYNGHNYTGSFTVRSGENFDQNLLIRNLDRGGEGPVITISMELPNGSFHNFIAPFDANGEVALSLGDTLNKFKNSAESTRDFQVGITLICGDDFEAINYTADRSNFILKVEGPTVDPQLKSPLGDCCGTNTNYIPCYITSVQGTALGYYKLSTINESGGTCSPISVSCKKGSLRVDWPNAGNIFHSSRITTFCKFSSPPDACITPMTKHYTRNLLSSECSGEQWHTWTGMVSMYNFGSSASVVATKGCQTGLTWTVSPAN